MASVSHDRIRSIAKSERITLPEALVAIAIGMVTAISLLIFILEGSWVAAMGLSASIGLLIAVLCPVRFLPALALAAFALLPITYAPQVNPIVGRYMAPAVFLLVIWFIRARRQPRKEGKPLPTTWFVLSGLLLAWSMLTVAWSIDAQRSIIWTATLAVVFIFPAWMSSRANDETVLALHRSWLWLGIVLGLMAILEGVLKVSILAPLYANTDLHSIGVNQVWSTVRATTTLGHPLMNATFFATTAAYAIIRVARDGSKLAACSAAACTAASIFTVSRSAVAALVIGLLVGILSAMFVGRMSLGRKFFWALTSLGVGFTVLNSPLITERSNSAEGQGSSSFRATVLDAAFHFASEDKYIGSGAGSSPTRTSVGGLLLPLENAYAGLLVSLGAIGCVLFILLIVGLIFTSFRRGLPEMAAGTSAFASQAAAYPLFDNVPVALVVLGTLAFLTFASDPQKSLKTEMVVQDLPTEQSGSISRVSPMPDAASNAVIHQREHFLIRD